MVANGLGSIVQGESSTMFVGHSITDDPEQNHLLAALPDLDLQRWRREAGVCTMTHIENGEIAKASTVNSCPERGQLWEKPHRYSTKSWMICRDDAS